MEIISRQRELASIRKVTEALAHGNGGSLAITGPAGIGKTALLRAITSQARERFAADASASVVMVAAAETERDWPYSGLHLVLSAVVGAVPGDAREKAELRVAEVAERLHTGSQPYEVAMRLQSLMTLADVPVLVVVDDAHHLDLRSQEVLGFIARRLRPVPVVLLFAGNLAVRPAPVLDGLAMLRLGELEPGDAGELLGTAHGDVAGGVADALTRRVGGNPRILLEIAAELTPEQRRGRAPLDRYLPVPPTVRNMLVPGLDGLSDAQRHALLVATVSEDHTIGPVVTALEPEGDDVVEWLLRSHLDVSAGTFTLRNPVVGSIVWHEASHGDKVRAHRALADANDGLAPDEGLWHRAQAQLGYDDELAGELRRRADDLLRRGELERSVAFARDSVRLTSSPALRIERLLLAGELALHAGRCEEAIQIGLERLRTDVTVDQRADLALLEARARLVADGQPPTELIDAQAATFVDMDPDRAAMYWLVAAAGFADRLEADKAGAYVARVERILARLSEPTLGQYRRIAAWLASLTGERERATELIDADSHGSDVLTDAERCTRHAMVLTRLERFDEARQLLRTITDQRRFGDSPVVSGYAYSVTAVLEIRAGRLAAAVEAAEGWDRMLGGIWPQRGKAKLYMIRAFALMGEHEKALECHAWGRKLAHRLGDWWTAALLQSEAGAMYLHMGRLEEAVSVLERAYHYALEYDDPSILTVEPDLVEAYVRTGQRERARSILEAYEPRATRVPGAWATHTLARCRALVADDEESVVLFERALNTCADTASPVELVRTLVCYGERLRRMGRRAEATEWIRRATVWANECGATGLVTAEEELGSPNGTTTGVDAPDDRVLSGLTEAELRVARLVAQGARNRDIAARLYVSVRTIEAHLGRIYRKLSVRSRAELAGIVSAAKPRSG
ncbi:helix-turn-helix transcriptional regulator [Phytoactinopolyspora halotolerans]|uniref:AAA family ATPase n=1 Tax=Phytoactinopolyspora halotolerans TaxID=1981512 RepID=A0A6L9SFR4_9ACTN|nr:LuxR family transcriptional regulator [Phytoactinopolyspora halotolerans]NEE03281.1 AAA family ATPase [Phytoactinopolyspora halotolerans]